MQGARGRGKEAAPTGEDASNQAGGHPESAPAEGGAEEGE